MDIRSVFLDETGSFDPKRSTERSYQPWIVSGIASALSSSDTELLLQEHLGTVLGWLHSTDWFLDFSAFVQRELDSRTWTGSEFGARNLGLQIVRTRRDPRYLHGRAFTEWNERWMRAGHASLHFEILELRRRVQQVIEDRPSIFRRIALVNDAPTSPFESVNYALALQELVFRLTAQSSNSPEFNIAYRKQEDAQDLLPKFWKKQFANAIASSFYLVADVAAATSPLNITINKQEESAGLVLADFVSGYAARRLGPRGDQIVGDHDNYHIDAYYLKDDLMDRRITLAVANGDLPRAFVYAFQEASQAQIGRLIELLLQDSRTASILFQLDAIIDAVDRWAIDQDKALVLCSLVCFFDGLWDRLVVDGMDRRKGLALRLLGRTLTYNLNWANHVGDNSECERIYQYLSEMIPDLRRDPGATDILRQAEIGCIEIAVNAMRHAEAAQLASEHLAGVLEEHGLVDWNRHLNLGHLIQRAAISHLRSSALMLVQSNDQQIDIREVYRKCRGALAELGFSTLETIGSNTESAIRLLQIAAYCAEALNDVELLGEVLSDYERMRSGGLRTAYSDYSHLRTAANMAMLGDLGAERKRVAELLVHEVASLSDLKHPTEMAVREAVIFGLALQKAGGEPYATCGRALSAWVSSMRPGCEVHKHQMDLAKLVSGAAMTQSKDLASLRALRRQCMY